jgi:radical SAM protein with 4Fe4S-binding SPASM domain
MSLAPGPLTLTVAAGDDIPPWSSSFTGLSNNFDCKRLSATLDEFPFVMDVCFVGEDPPLAGGFEQSVGVCVQREIAVSTDCDCRRSPMGPLNGVSQLRAWLPASHEATLFPHWNQQEARAVKWIEHATDAGVPSCVLVLPVTSSDEQPLRRAIELAEKHATALTLFPVPPTLCNAPAWNADALYQATRIALALHANSRVKLFWGGPVGIPAEQSNYNCAARLGIQLHVNLQSGEIHPCRWLPSPVAQSKSSLTEYHKRICDSFDRQALPMSCQGCPRSPSCRGGCPVNQPSPCNRDVLCKGPTEL